jgi:uncharacterized Zn-binding protein involved in type VI secretion
MAAAARVGDMTNHGTPLSPGLGSPNVTIGNQSAWRALADFHSCPKSEGPKPHVGGVVVKGSSRVSINGMAAAREGDTIVEVGPSNSIAAGFPQVEIGD